MRESRTSGSVGTPERVIARGDPAHRQVKIATLVDPDGNVLEVMELAKGVDRLPHP
jgi:hypothetical protein